MKKSKHFYPILSIILIILWIVASSFVLSKNKVKERLYLEGELASFDSKITATLGVYEKFSNYIFYNSIQSEEILNLIKDANSADEENQKKIRNKLYDMLFQKEELLVNYNFRQLHFHLANGDSFLRMHSPEKYGDNLLDIRKSIEIVHETQEYVAGFEEGRIYNGYRFVYPLFLKDEFLGSVEVSMSVSSAVEVFSKLYPNTDLFFIMNKSAVEKKVFKDQMGNYMDSCISSDYYFDKQVYMQSLRLNRMFTCEGEENIFESIKKVIEVKMETEESFSIVKNYKGRYYVIMFHSFRNIGGEHVGYLIGVQEDKKYQAVYKDYYIELILITMIVAIFLVALYNYNKNQKKLEELSTTDYLTKLYNRLKFMEFAEYELIKNIRYRTPFTILILDIDYFKKINDEYGHNEGDAVLVKMATVLKELMRKTDIVARWGGEEFICILTNTERQNAMIVAEKIRKKVEESDFGNIGKVTVSMGIYEKKDEDVKIEEIIDNADSALYMAKGTGRNKVIDYEDIK
jgi:diguanylate cyclase (GGDEF)-like protein